MRGSHLREKIREFLAAKHGVHFCWNVFAAGAFRAAIFKRSAPFYMNSDVTWKFYAWIVYVCVFFSLLFDSCLLLCDARFDSFTISLYNGLYEYVFLILNIWFLKIFVLYEIWFNRTSLLFVCILEYKDGVLRDFIYQLFIFLS